MLPSIFSESLFDDFFGDSWDRMRRDTEHTLYGKHEKNLMKTDVKETDSAYEVDMDLPGFEKDEIELSLENGYLTICATKGLDKEQKGTNGRYIRQERYAGSCSRSFYVGDVRREDIKAKYESGVLRLLIPKQALAQAPARKRIEIE